MLRLPLIALVLAPAVCAQTSLFSVRGAPGLPGYGQSSAGVGDIDRDGFADFIVGAPAARGFVGEAYIHSGRDGRLLRLLISGGSAPVHFGWSVAGAGDIDKDGYPDVLVGMINDTRNGINAGAMRAYSGKDGKVIYERLGDGPGDLFGESVDHAGDVNRDGYPDFIVGAPENGGDPVKHYGAGYARLFSGRDGATLHTFRGTMVVDEFGADVEGAGDLDGDGHDDVMVSSLLEGNSRGSVRAYSGKTYKVIHEFFGEPRTDHFGMSLAIAGDLDGDGVGDIVVGSVNAYSFIKGTVWVFSGRTGATLFKLRGGAKSGMLGITVRGLGDINGDGHADFMASDPIDETLGTPTGCFRVFSGKDGSELSVHYGSGGGFGRWSGIVGDLTGDGLPEFVVAAPGARYGGQLMGTATVFSVRNVAPVGTGCGTNLVAPRLDATQPTIGQSVTLFLRGASPRRVGALWMSRPLFEPVGLVGTCVAYLDLASAGLVALIATDASGRWSGAFVVPNVQALVGGRVALQAFAGPTVAPLGVDLTNGLAVTITR